MPVSPPQGQHDEMTALSPERVMDSCSVGESRLTAYNKGLVEGVEVTELIDPGSNVSPIFAEFRNCACGTGGKTDCSAGF